jgi:hypothetical protein
MRPNVISISPYATSDVDAIHVSSTPAAGGVQELAIDGAFASGGIATMDFRRQVFFTFAADESARVFVVIGTNSKGHQIIEAVPGGAATAQTINAFTTITSIKIDGDSAGAIEVGTGPTIVVATSWFPLDYIQDFKVSLVLNIPTGTLTPDFTVELTLSNLLARRGNDPQPTVGSHVGSEFGLVYPETIPVDHDTLVNVVAVAATSGNIAFPVRALRLVSNTLFTVNPVTLEIVQQKHVSR